MSRSSTSSSQAKDRPRRIETRYEQCPLCGSDEIHLGSELLSAAGPNGRKIRVAIRRWKCDKCGESFLTSDSRRDLDDALRVGQ